MKIGRGQGPKRKFLSNLQFKFLSPKTNGLLLAPDFQSKSPKIRMERSRWAAIAEKVVGVVGY
uniref:Uncharacterized protein n=1 Tax=Solanum tuberosum TaxID=4113 RepID=M1D7R6_SOLTU